MKEKNKKTVKKKESKPEIKEKKLTEKEKAFCVYYCGNGYNATQAAINAGYSVNTAKEIGYENLTKPHIQEEIKKWKLDFEGLMAAHNVTKERTVLEMANLAYSGIAHLHNTWIELAEFENLTDQQKKCIQTIDTKTETKYEGEGIKKKVIEVNYVCIKLYDKTKAVEILNKMMGWNATEKLSLEGKDGKDLIPIEYDFSKLSVSALKELLNAKISGK